MTDWQLVPAGLYVPPTAADGAYLPRKAGNRFADFVRLANGSGTIVNVDASTGEVSIDTATSGQYVLVSATDTGSGPVPEVVWGGDLELVYTEVGT